MDAKNRYLILKTVQDNNILPITSICNMDCRFCSHHQNPPGVKIYRFGHLELDFIEELMDYLSSEEPVILGESATRIIEGEPFIHPHFREIISKLHNKWPDKEIKITTNGSCLSEKMVKFIKQMEPIELNISLNCANPAERVFLMSDQDPEMVFKGLNYVKKNDIKFNGSIVAIPHLMGWRSLEETISLLADYNPQSIRVFLPGFTGYTKRELQFDLDLLRQLDDFIDKINHSYQVPVLLEPPHLKDFKVRIKGIIPCTPASDLGFKTDDIISKINGESPQTRVDAFNRLIDLSEAELLLSREEKQFKVRLEMEKGEKPGIILNYDLPGVLIDRFQRLLNGNKDKDILIVTSFLAADIIKRLVKDLAVAGDKKVEVLPVENKFFGGSIMSAGLLTNSDIISKLKSIDYRQKDLIVLPGIIFDIFGNDLTGSGYSSISDCLGVDIKVIKMN